MRLLSLTLDGQYKGLKDQVFDFNETSGNIIALIGLNGSGKSQLLELVAEIFAFLERNQRKDFKVKSPMGFGFELICQLETTTDHGAGAPGMECGEPTAAGGIPKPKYKVVLGRDSKDPTPYLWLDNAWQDISLQTMQLPYVVGYSSGLNENLQRSFMKNAVQYFEVQRIRHKRRIGLTMDLEIDDVIEINRDYAKKHPHIFSPLTGMEFEQYGYQSLKESDTAISRHIYLDYDSAGLAIIALAVLPSGDLSTFAGEVGFKYPQKVTFEYDFRNGVIEEDAIRDVKGLIDIAGEGQTQGLGSRTTDNQYDRYELDFLAGRIILDLTDSKTVGRFQEYNYGDPLVLFRRLYKLQQLGVKRWQYEARKQLQKDSFLGTVKKPLKTRLPLSVLELVLSDGAGREVCYDDLSDGEAQLLQVLAMAKIFNHEQALLLLDEPETHLNPSWRTYFHSHLSAALSNSELTSPQTQAFLSTHSPFMVSSLKREDVMFFERDPNGLINVSPVTSQTYGASFEVLIKKQFGLRSLISQTVVEAVRERLASGELPESIQGIREWVETNLGDSMEKAYLLRKLQD